MTTEQEMAAINALRCRQGVQEALPLHAAGYREPSVESSSYPWVPINDPAYPASVEWQNMIDFLSGTTARLGHCAQ